MGTRILQIYWEKLATLKIQSAEIEPFWANPEYEILLLLKMRFFNFFLNHMVQKYQNEIAAIFYYGISTKTNEKDLKYLIYSPLTENILTSLNDTVDIWRFQTWREVLLSFAVPSYLNVDSWYGPSCVRTETASISKCTFIIRIIRRKFIGGTQVMCIVQF